MNIFWFRRDLRLHDNAGLYHALKEGAPVIPVFIFDKNILEDLQDKDDARITFIHNALNAINEELAKYGSSLHVYHDTPEGAFEQITRDFDVKKVFTNNDYERYALDRDARVIRLLGSKYITFHSYKDQVIFEKDEVMKDDGTPYTVYTPYFRKWTARLNEFYLKSYPTEQYFGNFSNDTSGKLPSLETIGFTRSKLNFPGTDVPPSLFKGYQKSRDYPAEDGTSRLGVHLRFGTISIRELVRETQPLSSTFVSELGWREFYQMIEYQFPHIGNGAAFKKEYDRIKWRNNEKEFDLWCNGQTGYPLVDAGMRQLKAIGYMHNRVRMVAASFLCKHLLIDWRWGEAFFARYLLDYDFANNNGGWQWSAGSGCDAAPYFRIFNPTAQAKKFDPEKKYIRKWMPEVDTSAYPEPIVEHVFARNRCLEAYSKALAK